MTAVKEYIEMVKNHNQYHFHFTVYYITVRRLIDINIGQIKNQFVTIKYYYNDFN